MLPLEIERMADRHVPGKGKADIRRLHRGVVNETYRVLRDGAAYAMRVAAPNSLGFDRVWESRVLGCAAAADLAPAVEYCDPQRGIIISRWVEGRLWNPAEVRRPSNIASMADLMRRIHSLPVPAPARLMNAKMWIDQYSAAVRRNTSRFPDAAADLRTAAIARVAELATHRRVEPVICHSDLHTLNVLDCGGSLLLLDWEYAHAADPLWDLAGWSANNDFEDELQHDLLEAYSGRAPTPSDERRLNLSVWLYDYVCLLWCGLCLDPSGLRPGDAARESIAARGRRLRIRLVETASGRSDQVPAHYPP